MYRNARLDGLFEWVVDEPAYRRFDISFIGEPGPHEGDVIRAAWVVRVWSQKPDGTPRKPAGEGRADTLEYAVYRALDAYFNTPKPKEVE
jgi:hypothetical protein